MHNTECYFYVMYNPPDDYEADINVTCWWWLHLKMSIDKQIVLSIYSV